MTSVANTSSGGDDVERRLLCASALPEFDRSLVPTTHRQSSQTGHLNSDGLLSLTATLPLSLADSPDPWHRASALQVAYVLILSPRWASLQFGFVPQHSTTPHARKASPLFCLQPSGKITNANNPQPESLTPFSLLAYRFRVVHYAKVWCDIWHPSTS